MISDSMKEAVKAVRANGTATIILWLFAASILLLYFRMVAVRPLFDSLSALKIKYGFFFSFVSTALFGAVLPEILKKITSATKINFKKLAYLVLMWGYKGIEVDCLYRFQAYLFGSDNMWSTLLKKLAVDQLVYVTIWAAPSLIALLLLPEMNFRFHEWKKELTNSYYRRKVLPILFPNWAIWAPSALMIYSLPTSLQMPMQNIVLCFWVIVFTFMIKSDKA